MNRGGRSHIPSRTTPVRARQRGLCYWFVKHVEGSLCPNCRAYEKVYGRKAHEPIPEDESTSSQDGPSA